jgi:thioredoxin-related protein
MFLFAVLFKQLTLYFPIFSILMFELAFKAALGRRHWLGWACATACSGLYAQTGTPAVLPASQSLQAELLTALKNKQPLVVMVSLEGCPFCRLARRSHLVPMQKAGASIVQMDMRSAQPVLDFQGRVTTHDQIIKQWRVSIAPTLLFFGPGGKEVAERMEGGYLPDFYGPYLDERLAKSRQSL